MNRWTFGAALVVGLWGCGHVEGEGEGDAKRSVEEGRTATAGAGGNPTHIGTGGSIISCGSGPVPDVGTAGTGEVPGTGGSGGAGAPSQPFQPMCQTPNDFRSECSFEETCKQLHCGDGLSHFDAQGCRRDCLSSEDCGAGERCRFTELVLDVVCGPPSVVEGCTMEESGCGCSVSADCGLPHVCVSAEEYPAELDCDLDAVRCNNASDLMDFRLQSFRDDSESEWGQAINGCREKVSQRLEALGCPYEAPEAP